MIRVKILLLRNGIGLKTRTDMILGEKNAHTICSTKMMLENVCTKCRKIEKNECNTLRNPIYLTYLWNWSSSCHRNFKHFFNNQKNKNGFLSTWNTITSQYTEHKTMRTLNTRSVVNGRQMNVREWKVGVSAAHPHAHKTVALITDSQHKHNHSRRSFGRCDSSMKIIIAMFFFFSPNSGSII